MIHLERRGAVAVVRMEHGKANAMDIELFHELSERFSEIEKSDARGVVLTGTGSIFSAGVDLLRLLADGPDYAGRFLDLFSDGLLRVFTFPRPVVGAANGHAIAGGCILLSACDFRVMAQGSGTIGVPERVVGVPFPTLALEILRFAVPNQQLQELVYRGKTYGVEEALQKGLIDEAVPTSLLTDRACELAEQFGRAAPETFSLTKRLLREPTLQRFERERRVIDPEVAKVWTSPEAHAAIRAYMDRVVKKKTA